MCKPRLILFLPLPGVVVAGTLLLAVVWAILANCVASVSAHGQQPQTASWYADNPRALAVVTKACRDNPAEARTNPDCINASHAQILVMEREGRRRLVNLYPMNTTQFWQNEPLLRLWEVLALCKTMTPEQRRYNFCEAAERS